MGRSRMTEGPIAYSALTLLWHGVDLAPIGVSCTPLHSDDTPGIGVHTH